MNKRAILIGVVALVAGCSDSSSPPAPAAAIAVTVPANASPQVKQIVEAGWPKVLAACPGFQKYSADLTFVRVEDNLSYAPDDAKRVDVVLKVADRPTTIPAIYRSFGHNCFYSISPDGGQLTIGKEGCASTCVGEQVTAQSNGNYVIPLK